MIGNLTGRRFGSLTVGAVESQTTWKELRYFCRCDCGQTVTVFAGNLRSGRTQTCGRHRAAISRLPAMPWSQPYA
jgi:hypothetical protein